LSKEKKILFGVLNWGLGHATRSIPVIKQLLNAGYQIILASDGKALKLLQKEFPNLPSEKLPSYNIRYSKHGKFLAVKLLSQMPHIISTMRQESKITKKIVDKYRIDLIISDNRFGLRDTRINNIYITHQLRVLSGWSTPVSSWLHRQIYQKFDEVWVPDFENEPNLSGKLGHLSKKSNKIKYIGIVSRMQKQIKPVKYEVLAILSGPEPQRSLLEKKLITELSKLPFQIALVQGQVHKTSHKKSYKNIDIYNYLTTGKLTDLINASNTIISRSGYTSVMDLIAMEKKVIWIPTPGQKEQEYLAGHLSEYYGQIRQNQKKINIKPQLLKNYQVTKISINNNKTDKPVELIKKYFLD